MSTQKACAGFILFFDPVLTFLSGNLQIFRGLRNSRIVHFVIYAVLCTNVRV